MADVSLHCLSCSKTITVSQFADHTKLNCPDCGSNMSLSAPVETLELDRPGLRLRQNRPPASQDNDDEEPSQADLMQKVFMPGRGIVRKRTVSGSIKQIIAASLIFLVLAGAMYVLRYRDILPDSALGYMQSYGPYLVIALHFTIVTLAFRDSALSGVLCLLVPFYSLYYLLVADLMFLRAITLALLVGLGQDTFTFLSGHWLTFYDYASTYIKEGGR
jgi:DNA-directed RNA polymerase subunit RPC12/RpoP